MHCLSEDLHCRPPPECKCNQAACKICTAKRNLKATGGKLKKNVKLNPRFPWLPKETPLTYTLTMKACLSRTASERPTASQLRTLISDMRREVSQGRYVCTEGSIMVCICWFVFHSCDCRIVQQNIVYLILAPF